MEIVALDAADGGKHEHDKDCAANLCSQLKIIRLNGKPCGVEVGIQNQIHRILNQVKH